MTDILSGPRKDAQTRNLISVLRTGESKAERTQALERVTMLHMPLARSLAHRYSGKGLDREDLEQVAFLALLKAIQRFDLSKPTEFGAYATPTITGELRRHFRDHGWLVRPPRELAYALAMFVYSLTPPASTAPPSPRGATLFRDHCARCHSNAAYGGNPIAATTIGTNPALATGRGRGTGKYRVPSLLAVRSGAPYLHHGAVRSLAELLSPDRKEPGHVFGTQLAPAERDALIAFLETL